MQRRGSALILVVGLIVVMAAMAASFLGLMQQRHDLAYRLAGKHRLEVFTVEMLAGIERRLHDGAADGIHCFADGWYRDHQAVDTTGNPVWYWEQPNPDPRVNVNDGTTPWEHWGGWDGGDTEQWGRYPIEQGPAGSGLPTGISRWRYERFLDEDFFPVDSGDPVVDRVAARYALRYAATVFDNNGLLRVRPDHPLPMPILPAGAPGYEDFLAYQSYRWHFARSLKSMVAGNSAPNGPSGTAVVYQHMPADPDRRPPWPYDREYVNYGLDGEALLFGSGTAVTNIAADFRSRMANWFLETGLQPLNADGGAFQILPAGPFVAKHFEASAGEATVGPEGYDFYQILLGRAPGLRGDELGGPDPVTTPWSVNLMTAPRWVLHAVVYGLSRRVAQGAGADLFGPGYPEPFPLHLEEGRYIRLTGNNTGNLDRAAPYGWSKMPGQYLNHRTKNEDDQVKRSQELGYMADLVAALDLAIAAARQACNLGVAPDPAAGSEISLPISNAGTLRGQVLREFYRIIGEPDIDTGSSPPRSVDGIIAGGVRPVGYGGRQHLLNRGRLTWWPAGTSHVGDAPQEYGFLAPGANSRAIEYLLNDVCISLFGSANPDYDPAIATSYRDIAVDFNGDGMAESSVTGWWNGSRTVWSWWWNGLGPDEALDPDLEDPSLEHSVPEWMQQGAWFRIDPAGPQSLLRWNGHTWEDVLSLPEGGRLLSINKVFLHSSAEWPGAGQRPGQWGGNTGVVRPFSHTGRLFIGLSRSFTILGRCQLYDLQVEQAMIERRVEATWHRDPDGDGDADDACYEFRSDYDVAGTADMF